MNSRSKLFSMLFLVSALTFLAQQSVAVSAADSVSQPGYAIVATQAVLDDENWSKVVDTLKERRSANYEVKIFVWNDELQQSLADFFPKYACFVVKPEEASVEQLANIWALSRNLDDDPYGDVLWGIITGYDYEDAVRLAKVEDMVVERALGGTSIALKYFKKGVAYDEGKKNHRKVKEEGSEPEDRNDAPDDTTKAIAEALNDAQLFVTSGHASERNWSIGYSYKNGFFVAKDGKLYGKPSNDAAFEIHATGSKIHLASGNCLWGHIDKPDCMALAMIRNANVDMLIGYVVPTWFGYMGWGVQDYYIEEPGRFTVAEAFFANNQALLNLLQNPDGLSAQTKEGLRFDRDVVVLYGDPAWQNALRVQDSGWKQELTSEPTEDGRTLWTLTITPLQGDASYRLVDGNGSERGGRPFFQFFPTRVSDPVVVDNADLDVVAVDNFILAPCRNKKLSADKPIVIKVSTK